MIRIVGVQRHSDPTQEFVLLQNQGGMRVQLRGHALVAEAALNDRVGFQEVFVLREDVSLQPGQYALVRTCQTSGRWCHKQDGYSVYYLGLDRLDPVWNNHEGPIHILAPQHTFCERQSDAYLVKS